MESERAPLARGKGIGARRLKIARPSFSTIMEHRPPEKRPHFIGVNRLASNARVIHHRMVLNRLAASNSTVGKMYLSTFPFHLLASPAFKAAHALATRNPRAGEYLNRSDFSTLSVRERDYNGAAGYRIPSESRSRLSHMSISHNVHSVDGRSPRTLNHGGALTPDRLRPHRHLAIKSGRAFRARTPVSEFAVRSKALNLGPSLRVSVGRSALPRPLDGVADSTRRNRSLPMHMKRSEYFSKHAILHVRGHRVGLSPRSAVSSFGSTNLNLELRSGEPNYFRAGAYNPSASGGLIRLFSPEAYRSADQRTSRSTNEDPIRVASSPSTPTIVVNYSPKVAIQSSIESDSLEAKVLSMLKRHGYELRTILAQEIAIRRRTEF